MMAHLYFLKQAWQFLINLIDKISLGFWILLILISPIVIEYVIGESYFFLVSVMPVLITWWICHYKYQSIQSPPKLKGNKVTAGGFTWISFESKGIPEILRPKREASGLMWEGFTTGISNENGKAGSIAVWFYGSNEGVGHYVFLERTNRFHSSHGEGHFNLKVYAKKDRRWATKVLRSACESVSKDVERFYRPLSTSYDESSGKIRWYDDKSGRDVYFREKRNSSLDDLFIFGPYPKKLKNFLGHIETPRLIFTSVEKIENGGHQRIIINAKDIYGQSLEHAYFVAEGIDSNYKYTQKLPSNGEFLAISIPLAIQKLMIKVYRGGYGELKEEIEIGVGDIKVRAILEPLRDDE